MIRKSLLFLFVTAESVVMIRGNFLAAAILPEWNGRYFGSFSLHFADGASRVLYGIGIFPKVPYRAD